MADYISPLDQQVRAVACPACGADEGKGCRTSRGDLPRVSHCSARILEYQHPGFGFDPGEPIPEHREHNLRAAREGEPS